MKILSVTVALLALGATSPALAADLGDRSYGQAPAYAAPIYNWTGFYIGGHVGGGINSNEALNGIVTSNKQKGRLLRGGQARAPYQVGALLGGGGGPDSWRRGANNGTVFPRGVLFTN